MPTYTVKTSNLKLSKEKKDKIARGITRVHNKTTGANSFFAQVIFEENKKNNHYMGGKMITNKQIFLQGQIRAGRTSEIKKKLILSLRNTIIKNSKLNKDSVWIYLLDIIPEQMIEYGEILPLAGKEVEWFKSLPVSLQEKLKKLD